MSAGIGTNIPGFGLGLSGCLARLKPQQDPFTHLDSTSEVSTGETKERLPAFTHH